MGAAAEAPLPPRAARPGAAGAWLGARRGVASRQPAPMAERRVSRWYFGGLASSGAACCTHPLDLLKVRGWRGDRGEGGGVRGAAVGPVTEDREAVMGGREAAASSRF